MKITLAAGHNRVPNKGASGILDEDKCTRETAKALNDILLTRGHEVYDVTPYDRVFHSSADALRAESEAVNRIMPDLHICIHYNAYNKVSEGTEVLVYSEKSKAYPTAVKVLDSIVKAIGTKSRGVKVRSDLHILRVTKCPTILTEGLFIDNANDCKKYNAMKIATAIADAVVGKEATKYDMVEKTPVAPADVASSWATESWAWGIEKGITDGTSPKENPTREQIVQMLYNFSKKE